MTASRPDRASRFGFGEGIAAAAAADPRVVCLGGDITASVCADIFRGRFPDRFFSVGIAEQNMAEVAAGMALEGLRPVIASYATFLTTRSLDQIRVSICYNNLPVVIGGAHAGISVGPDGATHQALEDIAVMRSLPRMTVLSPCDATQAEIAARAALEQGRGPVYIRFGRNPIPDFTSAGQDFKIGRGQILRQGSGVTLVATGPMVYESLEACKILAGHGIDASVVNLHTIKPIDEELLAHFARTSRLVVTVEDHQTAGGLGGAVAETLARTAPCRMAFVGVDDSFGESGEPGELFARFGLDRASIARKVMETININDR